MKSRLLALALWVKTRERLAYAAAFLPAFILFTFLAAVILGSTANALGLSLLSGLVMGGLAAAALWLLAQSKLNNIVAMLETTPYKRIESPSPIDRALARVVHVFAEKKLDRIPLAIGESGFYSPKPFLAVMLKPAPSGKGTVVTIGCDEDDETSRAIAEFIDANLRID